MIFYNTLPGKFGTWNGLWAYVRDRIQPSYTTLQWAEFGNADVYEFSIDYLKARCYDEFLDFYVNKLEKPDPYEYIHQMSPVYLIDQIDTFLHLQSIKL